MMTTPPPSDGTTTTPVPEFPPVPWPSWIGHPEPHFLKTLPGGSVTAFTAVFIAFGILWQIMKTIVWACRKHKNIDHHVEAARDAGGAAALAHCIGPKLVLVFTQEMQCKAPSACCTPLLHPKSPVREAAMKWLRSPTNVVCVPISFPEGSDLYKHEVWVVGIDEENLEKCAERFDRMKLVSKTKVEDKFREYEERPRKHTLLSRHDSESLAVMNDLDGPLYFHKRTAKIERERLMHRLRDPTGKFNVWLPYTRRRRDAGLFKEAPDWRRKGDNERMQKGFFSPSEVTQTLLNVLGHAQNDRGEPIFLAAFEVGEILAGFPLVDRDEDKREFEEVLAGWWTIFPWRRPPTEDLARLFGPSVAIYFNYMHLYLMNLTLPAAAVVASFVWHLQHRDPKLNIRWGAAFGEGWSQAGFALCLSMWSTIFFIQWKTRVENEVYRLGQDQLHKDAYSIDGSHMYFKRRGFKISRKHGLYEDKCFTPVERSGICAVICTTFMTYFAIFFFLALSCLIIAGLCWVSDKAAMVKYSSDETKDEMLKNLVSVASYLVVSTPLQGVWNRITEWITTMENRKEPAEFVDRLVRRKAFFVLINYMGWFLYLGFIAQNVVALRSQLMVFFVLKPSGLLGTIVELLGLLRTKHKPYKQDQILEMIEQEWDKDQPNLFDEYLEVTIIFAAALLFAPIFPEGLFIAALHTFFEYIADKIKLYYYMRIQMPLSSDFFAVSAWASIWQTLGWVGIFVSTWLVNVFLQTEHLSTQEDTWDPDDDKHLRWDDLFFHGLPPDGRRIFTIVIIEHFLLTVKAYLNITTAGSSREVDVHREIVRQVLHVPHSEDRESGMEELTADSSPKY